MNHTDFSKLETLSKCMAQKEYLLKKQKKLSEALNDLTQEEIRLASILKKETADYEKLERLSLTGLIALISRDYEEKKTKEYNEMRMAEYKYQELMDRIEELKTDLEATGAELATLKEVENEYKLLLEEKLSWATGQNIRALKDYETKLHSLRRELKEADEAIVACEALITSLKASKDSLSSAQNWGIYDILGGGLVSSLIKHDHLDQAAATIQNASQKARKLQVELKDLDQFPNVEDLHIDQFSKTFDIFLDNIFSDFAIQTEIDETSSRISSNYKESLALLERLQAHRSDTANAISTMTKERNQYLVDHC